MNRFILFISCILLWTTVHAGKMYTWVDEDGNMQYSQTPPPETVKAQSADLPSVPGSKSTADAEKEATNPTESAQPPKDELKNTSKEKLMDASCERAKSQIDVLSTKQQLTTTDENDPGNFKMLTDEMRQQRLTEAQSYFDKYCQNKPTEGMETQTDSAEGMDQPASPDNQPAMGDQMQMEQK